MTLVNARESTPVTIGSITLYCEKMKLSASTTVYQNVTVTGTPVTTNKFRRYTTITFSGRVYNSASPLMLTMLANNINGSENLDVVYRGVKFPKCTITGIEAEDLGENFVYLTISVSTGTIASVYNG